MTTKCENSRTRSKLKRTAIRRAGSLVLMAVFAVGLLAQNFTRPAEARDYDAEIKALQKQIDDSNAKKEQKASEAKTLQDKVNELQNQQNELQTQINLSETQKSQLNEQISVNEDKIKKQSTALSKNLADMYYSSKTSTIDVILNSNSISDYVDRQTRQQAMSDSIAKAVGEVKQLKSSLEQQKTEVEKVINKQTNQKLALEDTKKEKNDLLAQTKGDEAKFQQLSSETKAKQEKVQKEQQDAIAAYLASLPKNDTPVFTPGGSTGGSVSANGDSYPFRRQCPKKADTSGYDASTGFKTSGGNMCECVNYVQWKIFQQKGRSESHGHAKYWPTNLGMKPQVNSVAVQKFGEYGHVAWVEQVGTGAYAGQVFVSQYNWTPFVYSSGWASISIYDGFYKNW